MRESSVVLYNTAILDTAIGEFSSVEFDFLEVWRSIKKINEFHLKYLSFLHVHPVGVGTDCSSTDVNCMEGLTQALGGHDFNFYIVEFFNENLSNYDCVISNHRGSYEVDNENKKNFMVKKVSSYVYSSKLFPHGSCKDFGENILVILKLLSCGIDIDKHKNGDKNEH